MDLRQMFGRIQVVNLDRRQDRLQSFRERADAAGLEGVERFRAVEAAAPAWFAAGDPAWSCLSSHLRIVQDAAQDGLDSVLIFEDDATFRPGAAERMALIMSSLHGVEWDMLYFGGQHLHKAASPPWPFKEGLIRCRAVNRTHAYAVSKRFYRAYQAAVLDAGRYARHVKPEAVIPSARGPHLDHLLCLAHGNMDYRILAADPWLCGQAAGPSDVWQGHIDAGERYWDEKGWGE